MLGRYEDFPEIVHGVARLTHECQTRSVQQTILSVLHNLNRQVCSLSVIVSHLPEKCEVSFEVGVAEGSDFNFLDEKELGRLEKAINDREFSTLDFFFVFRYHIVNDLGKRVPLKFDYHILRFIFQGTSVELRICHERGTQRVPLEDLVTFITKRVNEELSQRQLKPLNLEYLRVLY